jgi:hypothetical protein
VKQAYTRYVRRSAARRAASDRQFQITPAKLQISRFQVVRRLCTHLFKIGGKPCVRAFTTELKKMREKSPVGIHLAGMSKILGDVLGFDQMGE